MLFLKYSNCSGYCQNYLHPWWGIIVRSDRQVHRFIFCQRQNRESTEGYSKWKVKKRHGKFRRTGVNNYSINSPKKKDDTRCPEGQAFPAGMLQYVTSSCYLIYKHYVIVKMIWYCVGFVFSPHLRQYIALFVVAKGWLFLDIG